MTFAWFDRVYCIHLPNAERRAAIEAQFASVGIADVKYLHAKPPGRDFKMSNLCRANANAGEFGANMSHVKALVRAIAEGSERPLFLEDDIVFREGAVERLAAALADLPADWDMLYLGGHPRGAVTRVGASLVQISGGWSFAESYSIRRPALLGAFDHWTNRITQPRAVYDHILGEYAAARRSFCVYPVLTDQPPGWSQIGRKVDDKRHLVERGWQNNLA